MLAFSLSHAQITYVKQGAQGDGSSWENAMGDLRMALQQARPGTQVWVAQGVYTPSQTDRTQSFVIKDGVQLYGGFQGHESSLEQRDPVAHPTVLSGEIGRPGIADNSFNVIYTRHVGPSTVVDGFIIRDGNANGEGQEGARQRCGGGWYNDGSNGFSSPRIVRCVFENNFGRDGAALYNHGRNGESSPMLSDCVFRNNEAGLDGGAVYNNGTHGGKSNPEFRNCLFQRNIGTYGGAIFNATEKGSCNILLDDCTFVENSAFLRGGAIFSMNGIQSCYLEMSNCVFSDNYPDDQNTVFTSNTMKSKQYSLTEKGK